MRPFARRALLAAASLVVLAAHPALAAAPSYTTPNIDNTPSGTAETTTLGGNTFTNWGLVGTGRLSANQTDFLGDTLGSFSSLAIQRSTWRVDGNGNYSFSMYTLPDRGRNDPSVPLFFDYPARLNSFDATFTPYSGPNLPASTSSQDQVVYEQTGGIELLDFNGNPFTGADPGTGTKTENGVVLPSPASGTGAGKISIDAEAISFRSDGSFYVSDEYASAIYYFSADGKLQGVIQPPKALQPFTGGNLNYNSLNPPTDGGRRNNQGLEGMSVTPDGKYVIAVLQSATVQDTQNSNQANRTNTRVLVYDISKGDATPDNPVGHYVLQLPTYTFGGTGGAVNRTAAQSEALAINDYQFLTLARDGGTGLGTGATNNFTYRSILLVDTRGATNLAGTSYETSYTPVDSLVGGSVVLNSGITPVSTTQLVNMLNPTQLANFGLTTSNTDPHNPVSWSEKWEGMSLMPKLDEKHPQDFLLFVSNDNDYVSTSCTMSGIDCSSSYNNDNMILVYQVTLPTAVDPEFYDYMVGAGAATTTMAGDAGISAAEESLTPIQDRLGVLRGAAAGGTIANFNVWGTGLYNSDDRHHDYVNHVSDLRGTIGADANLGNGVIVGGVLGFGGGHLEPSSGFRTESRSVSLGVYGTYDTGGFFASAAYGYLPWIDFSEITRPAAYGLTATGSTKGTAQTAYGELGYMIGVGGMTKLGPVASLSYLKADIDGYTEHGAAGGNIAYSDRSVDQTTLGLGGEIIVPFDDVTLTGHAAYDFVLDKSNDTVNLALASVADGLGSASVTVPTQNEDDVRLGIGAQGSIGKGQTVGWTLGYDARIGKEGGVASLINAGLNIQF